MKCTVTDSSRGSSLCIAVVRAGTTKNICGISIRFIKVGCFFAFGILNTPADFGEPFRSSCGCVALSVKFRCVIVKMEFYSVERRTNTRVISNGFGRIILLEKFKIPGRRLFVWSYRCKYRLRQIPGTVKSVFG